MIPTMAIESLTQPSRRRLQHQSTGVFHDPVTWNVTLEGSVVEQNSVAPLCDSILGFQNCDDGPHCSFHTLLCGNLQKQLRQYTAG